MSLIISDVTALFYNAFKQNYTSGGIAYSTVSLTEKE